VETNLTRNEVLIEDGLTYTQDAAHADLDRIHNVYRDTLNAMVKSCIANKLLLSQHEIEVAMEGVAEALANEADRALELLPNETYTPEDAKKLVAKAHVAMVDALRVKRLDYEACFAELFRPLPTRGSAPQNPATLAAKGEL
jgi:hypothetical protein